MIPHSAAYLVLVANMALWGGALVVARGIHELAPPMALTFWRWVVAVLVLLPFVARKLRQELPSKPQARRSIYWICMTMAAGTTLSVVAVSFTTAINATVINATQPALTALAAFLLVRERLFPAQTLGVVLAFLGVIVMVSQESLGALLQMNINIGDLVRQNQIRQLARRFLANMLKMLSLPYLCKDFQWLKPPKIDKNRHKNRLKSMFRTQTPKNIDFSTIFGDSVAIRHAADLVISSEIAFPAHAWLGP